MEQQLQATSRSPLAELLVLALPTVAQMASYTVIQFTDTYMLSRLGELEATAAGNASFFGFALISLGFGTMWVVNTLVSQAFGRGDNRACGEHLWAGVWLGVAYGVLLLPVCLLADEIFNLLPHESDLAKAEADYLAIVLSFTALRLVAAAAGQFLLAVDRANLTLLAAFVGAGVNVLANYVLIYGHFGFPAMGVAGAAWGANVGAGVELLVLVFCCSLPSICSTYGVCNWRPRWKRLRTLIKVGLPSGGQMLGDVTAWTAFSLWVMAPFGTQAMAANTFLMRFMSMSFLPVFGLSAGVTALVGRYIGRGQPDVACQRAALGFKLAAAFMLTCGLCFLFFGGAMIGLFTDDPEVRRMGTLLMKFAAAYQLFDALYIIYVGALRGAGDTFWPAVATAGLCWLIVVGVAGVLAYGVPELGIAGPWISASVYGVLLGLFMWLRFKAGGWRSIQLDAEPANVV
ncbi:MAG: MATE family efflux transporter [Planctomycetota bacterium]